ncbi:MAG: peptidoglycan DD-metalloendopeptidase family protein [Deltaproteobacteria bacterium]|nr:peptidoglycan DD-metalloendopeptidase family protein [Deltaproteobacteria bacterium]MBW2123011.1 peptidoglycan DD-metalloendopeptidase family protein [Deltaproteobacteria bacterium]
MSGGWFGFLAFVLCAFLFASGFLAWHYFRAREARLYLASLREESEIQKSKLRLVADRISHLETQISKIREFDSKLRVVANLEPPPSTTSGIGGPTPKDVREEMILQENQAGLVRQMKADLERLAMEAQVEQASLQRLETLLQGKREQLACTPSILPARGWISSGFGYRISPFTGTIQMHEGIDISNAVGTPIVAPADGLVVKVGREYGYGKVIVINHGYGIITLYGHLHKTHVKIGQKVKRGDLIGEVGNTGRSTGPHLHYEVRVRNVPVDPRKYILFGYPESRQLGRMASFSK